MKWICSACQHIHEDDALPDTCPACGEPKELYSPVEEPQQVIKPRKWYCTVCKYIAEGEGPPDICPKCKKPWTAFIPHVEDEDPSKPKKIPTAKANAPKQKSDRWRCAVCNYIHNGSKPADICPICGAGADAFVPELKSPLHHHRGLSGHIEKLHLHPVSAHMPNASLPLAFLAWVLYLTFGDACLERASFYLMMVALFAAPVTFLTGLSDAKHRFGTSTTGVFPEKKRLSLVLLVVGVVAIAWRLSLGWSEVPETQTEIVIYTGLLLICTGLAARLGMLGGKLVFGH